jgi:hypothetical protein
MRIRILGTIILMINLSFCNSQRNNILSVIHSKGLDAENLGLNSSLFLNSNTGFIAGSSDIVTHNPDKNSDTFAIGYSVALLYNTMDGGKT